MKLSVSELRELFRDAFIGPVPMSYSPNRRRELAAQWTQWVGAIDGTKLTTHPGDKDPRSGVLCRFVIPDPADSGYLDRQDELRIEHDRENRIVMRCVKADIQEGDVKAGHMQEGCGLIATIAGQREVDDLVGMVTKAYVRRGAEAKKRQAIQAMKATAVRAAVAKLAVGSAQRLATSAGADAIEIYVEWSPSQIATLAVPWSDFAAAAVTIADQIAVMGQRFETGNLDASELRDDLPAGVDWITA